MPVRGAQRHGLMVVQSTHWHRAGTDVPVQGSTGVWGAGPAWLFWGVSILSQDRFAGLKSVGLA